MWLRFYNLLTVSWFEMKEKILKTGAVGGAFIVVTLKNDQKRKDNVPVFMR